MIGLDTNILARYYISNENDDEITKKQAQIAKQIIDNSPNLLVANTVAFHLASYQHCGAMYSFDDKGFARKVNKHQFLPSVIVPSE